MVFIDVQDQINVKIFWSYYQNIILQIIAPIANSRVVECGRTREPVSRRFG